MWKGEHVNIPVNASPGQRKRDSLLDTMGYVAANITWPMERAGQCTVQVQVWSSDWRATAELVPGSERRARAE